MLRGVNFAAVLAAFLSVSSAVQSPFPRDRTLVYNYHAELTARTTTPKSYASQFAISGEFYVKPDTNDVSHPNAFVTALKNLKIALHNGEVMNDDQSNTTYVPIPEAARVLENPFLIVYNESGHMIGVKMSENEPGWAKNMKRAMASMFQLDQRVVHLDSSETPQKFASKENTIYGDCLVDYKMHTENGTNEFIIRKSSSPKNCSNYKPYLFDHVEYEDCDVPTDKQLAVENSKLLVVEKTRDEAIIKIIIAKGEFYDFPETKSSDGRSVLHTATFILRNGEIEDFTPDINFSNLPLIKDLIYQSPPSTYAQGAALDITEGRLKINQSAIMSETKLLLDKVVDYTDEDHLKSTPPKLENSQLINKILSKMSLMTVESFYELFDELREYWYVPREEMKKNLFLEIVPHVGTQASSIFIKKLIVNNLKHGSILNSEILSETGIKMLTKLSTKIRHPSEELLRNMEDLIIPDYPEVVSPKTEFSSAYEVEKVRATVMVNFATLVFRTFKNAPDPENNELLNKYIDIFENDLVKSKYYQRKMIAVQALGNVQLGRSRDILASVIRDDLNVGRLLLNEATDLRLHAIWAIEKSLANYEAAHELLWPIVTDEALPLKLRLAAYDILIRKSRKLPEILSIHSFMLNDTNLHLQHYHYTTIKNIAEAEDTCNIALKELTEELLAKHTPSRPSIIFSLSRTTVLSSTEHNHGHGNSLSLSYTLNQSTRELEVVTIEYSTTDGSRRTVPWKIQLVLKGPYENLITQYITSILEKPITYEALKEVLDDIRGEPKETSLVIDLVISSKGHVVYAKQYSGTQFMMVFSDVYIVYASFFNEDDRLFVFYDDLSEEQVVTEMGIPVFKQVQTPMVTLTKLAFDTNLFLGHNLPDNTDVFDFRLKTWRHSDNSLMFYNPISNLWHSVSRSVSMHVELPLAMALSTASAPLEIRTPVLALTSHTTRGMLTYSQDYTEIRGALNTSLKSRVIITKGESTRKNQVDVIESQFTGFQLKRAVFDCENDAVLNLLEKNRVSWFNYPQKTWRGVLMAAFTAYRQYFDALTSTSARGSCGVLYRKAPSTVNPTSWIKATLNVAAESQNFSLLGLATEKTDFYGSFEAISAETNETDRAWLLNGTYVSNEEPSFGYFNLTKVEPNRKQFRACLKYNARKNHGAKDILGILGSFSISLTLPIVQNLTLNMAEVDDNRCPSNETNDISILIGNYLSDEQMNQFQLDYANGACRKDINNPLFSDSKSVVPRTVNCLNHAIKYTTMRQYDVLVHFRENKELMATLRSFEDIVNNLSLGTAIHEQSGPDFKFLLMKELPLQKSLVFGLDFYEYPWAYLIGNSKFPVAFLAPYVAGELRVCSLHAKAVATPDGDIVPHDLSNRWVLASGEYIDKTFGILVRSVNGTISWKVHVEDQSVEYSDEHYLLNDKQEATINEMFGKFVYSGASKKPLLRFSRFMNTDVIEFKKNLVTMLFSKDYVTIIMNYRLEARTGGLCRDPGNERNIEAVSTV